MHDWPNAPSPDPLNTLRHDVQTAGSLSVTAGDLASRFGIQRLTPNARAQIAADLEQVGLLSTPSFAEAERGDQVTLTATAEHAPTNPRRRLPLKWLVVAPFVLLLLLAAVAIGGHPSDKPKVAARPTAARVATTPTQTVVPAPEPIDNTEQIRAEAEDMASAGKWIAAATLLHGNDDDTYADNLARRGARSVLRSARRALRAGRYARARTLTDRADRLAPTRAAADIRRSAIGRAAARRKAKRVARDRRFCSASEQGTVDFAGTVPSGCGAYARQKRAEDAAAAAAEQDPVPATDSGSTDEGSSSGGGFGCDGDPGATPYPQHPGQRDGDGDGCYGES